MSEPSEHPMDARLRSYASKRRSQPGAPESLHPATRHLLQSEVRRTFGARDAKAAGSQSPWWRRWPGLVTLGTACAAVAIALIVTDREMQQAAHVSQDRKPDVQSLQRLELDFAKSKQDGLMEAPVDRLAALNVPAEPMQLAASEPRDSTVALADSESAAQKPAAFSEFRFQQQRPSPATTPAMDRFDPATTVLFFRAPSPESGVRQLAESKDSRPPLVRHASPAASTSSPHPTAPLTEFNLQHTDGKLTIQDSDGSVYLGTIRQIEAGSQIVGSADKSSTALSSRGAVQGNAIQSIPVEAGRYRIRATGTNRSLQQQVLIDGELLQRQPRIANSVVQDAEEMRKLERRTLLATNSVPAQWEFDSLLNIGTQRPVKILAIQTPTATPSNSPAPRQP